MVISASQADIYMHNPRGSNNKLNEQSNNVQNNRRLFDSQNNGQGGYQVGDACVPNCLNDNGQYDRYRPGAGEGVMEYCEGSELEIQWTNQHGCGVNPRLHCQIIIQYGCEDHPDLSGLRDGKLTGGFFIPHDLSLIVTDRPHSNEQVGAELVGIWPT